MNIEYATIVVYITMFSFTSLKCSTTSNTAAENSVGCTTYRLVSSAEIMIVAL